MKTSAALSLIFLVMVATPCFSMSSGSHPTNRDTSQQRQTLTKLQDVDLVEGYATAIEHHTGFSYVRCEDGQEICFMVYTDEYGIRVGCADPNNACIGKTYYYPRFVGGVSHLVVEQGEGYAIWMMYTATE